MIHVAVHLARPGFSLEVDLRLAARATGVFGPSGAGKSTFLHAIAGLVRADRQDLTVGDCHLDGEGFRTALHRRQVAVVFQDHRLFPHLDAAANLRFGLCPGPVTFDQVVELLDLAPLLDRRPVALSGGECQRVALGRALLSQPRLLLLDEPLASLDRGRKAAILPYLRRLGRLCPAPIIHVSHDLDELLAVTDELILLRAGRVVAHGRFTDLASRPESLAELHGQGLVNVIPAVVTAHDHEDGITWLTPRGSGTTWAVARTEHAVGSEVELLLRPADVVLAHGLPTAVSLGGRCEARITGLVRLPVGVLVQMEADGVPLLAEIGPRALREFGLAPGQRITALWKVQAAVVRGA